MASTLRLSVDIKNVGADLRAIADGLDSRIAETLEGGANQIARAARPLVAGKPPWRGSTGEHALPITYKGVAAAGVTLAAYVTSPHPGAPVQEYGGTIHPRGGITQLSSGGVHIVGKHAVGRAGAALEADVTHRLEQSIADLIKEHGF
jgi:hypothetical protein